MFFSDVNGRGCPGMSIETIDGKNIGIYAQEGLGFILYDYSAHNRLGICPFTSVSRIAVRQLSTPSQSVPGGGFASYSADASTDGGTPIGIVGLTSNHPTSLYVLSFNLFNGMAWAQVKSISRSDLDIAIRFYVLYEFNVL